MTINRGEAIHELARWHSRWKKNRDFLSGRDAVIQAGTRYLPKPTYGMGDDEYNEFKKEVGFYPACITVMEGWLGLIFRDDPDLIAEQHETLLDLEQCVTRDGDSLEEFAQSVVRETLTTNWAGILVDHPTQPEGVTLTAANAIDEGFRPFLALYPAESILDVEYGIVRNRRVIAKVRLRETDTRELELKLVNGIYHIETWDNVDGQWLLTNATIPTRGGKPLDFIPFKIATTKQAKYPTPAPFEHMVDLNCEMLIIEGKLAQAQRHAANPIITASGVKVQTDENGKAIERQWILGPGTVWEFEGEVKVDVTEFEGHGITRLQTRLDEKKSQLARTGARILQDDKAAAEAAETVVIRQTSDNSRLAGMSRIIARHIQDALRWMAWWLGADNTDDVSFELNYDYTSNTFTKEDLDALVTAYQAGWITKKIIYHYLTRPGGLIDPAVSYDEWRSQLEAEALDSPSAGLTFKANNSAQGDNSEGGAIE